MTGYRRRLLRFLFEPLVNHQKIAVSTFEKIPDNQFAIKYDDTRMTRGNFKEGEMKELYKPVFWCGFALSLSALYASSEDFQKNPDGHPRQPVLLQISIGKPAATKFDSKVIESSQFATGETIVSPPIVSETPIPMEGPVLAPGPSPTPIRNSVFFSAARRALGGGGSGSPP